VNVSADRDSRIPRAVKRAAVALLAVIGLIVALFLYATHQDRKNLGAATNACERGCVQDSGGIDQCRTYCAAHPDRYP
jgi:hypothetical protein